MKNASDELTSRLDTAEESIPELQDISTEISKAKKKRTKTKNQQKQTPE